ncbi:hypothetical protein ACSQ67_020943 [Phaseolus vulgaris]
MGLHHHHLLLLFLLLLLLLCSPLPRVRAQSSEARSLDAILQEYAYRALVKPKTGTIYNATSHLPSNFSGVKIAALRLRSGSLRRRGVVPSYNEFEIPIGIIEKPYVKRLVLVYQNLGNWSKRYYPLPNYTYLAPVLGLLAYNGSNLSATNLPTLNVSASADPIRVKFMDVRDPPLGAVARCVWFDLQGLRQECTKGNGSLKLESLVQEESKLLRIRLATCLEIVFTLPWVQVAGVVILQI